VFAPREAFHWPDRAGPAALAGYTREAVAIAITGGQTPSLP
jgi:hypothetical protein